MQNNRRNATSRTSVWVWVGAAAVVAVALGVAVLISTSSNSSDITTGEVTATGNALPPFTGETPDPTTGAESPLVRGTNFAAEPVTVGEPGTPQVLVFLAHWCPVCQREVPVLVQWAQSGGDTQGVEVIGVATGIDRTRGNWPPGAWLRQEGWPYQTIVDNPSSLTAEVFGLTSFPYFVAIDATGTVVGRAAGEIGTSGFAALIEAARTGTPLTGTAGGESTPSGLPQ